MGLRGQGSELCSLFTCSSVYPDWALSVTRDGSSHTRIQTRKGLLWWYTEGDKGQSCLTAMIEKRVLHFLCHITYATLYFLLSHNVTWHADHNGSLWCSIFSVFTITNNCRICLMFTNPDSQGKTPDGPAPFLDWALSAWEGTPLPIQPTLGGKG